MHAEIQQILQQKNRIQQEIQRLAQEGSDDDDDSDDEEEEDDDEDDDEDEAMHIVEDVYDDQRSNSRSSKSREPFSLSTTEKID